MWARIVNTAAGLWLMAAPAVLGYGDPAQFNDRIAGPLAVTCAFVAIWEATRPLRRVNLVIGAWLLLAPFVLGYGATAPIVNSIAVGVVMIACSFVKGTVENRYGGGWSMLWR
jgi:hypothetical protein